MNKIVVTLVGGATIEAETVEVARPGYLKITTLSGEAFLLRVRTVTSLGIVPRQEGRSPGAQMWAVWVVEYGPGKGQVCVDAGDDEEAAHLSQNEALDMAEELIRAARRGRELTS